MKTFATALTSLALASASLAAQAAVQFNVTDLGAGTGLGISSSGNYVIGNSSTGLFTWSDTGGRVDWTMPASTSGVSSINNNAINNNGLAVATLSTGSGSAPYAWMNGTLTALALPAGNTSAYVSAVNDNGIAVGHVGSGTTGSAVVYNTATNTSSLISATGTFAGNTVSMSTALGVTNGGLVTGYGYYVSNGATIAVPMVYNMATDAMSTIDMSSVNGALGGLSLYGTASNGNFTGQYGSTAFSWSSAAGAVAVNGPTGKSMYANEWAINASGAMVGTYTPVRSALATYTDSSGSYYVSSLLGANTLGWNPTGLYGIADNGSIIGSSSGKAVLLTAVPEPTTWALMLAGLCGVGAIARRRRQEA